MLTLHFVDAFFFLLYHFLLRCYLILPWLLHDRWWHDALDFLLELVGINLVIKHLRELLLHQGFDLFFELTLLVQVNIGSYVGGTGSVAATAKMVHCEGA